MHRFIFVTALGLACGPLAATAEPLLSFGRQVPVYITASGSLRYDDNIFFANQNQEEDVIFIFTPGIDLAYTGADTTAGIRFSEQLISYMSNPELDSNLSSFSGQIAHERPRSSASLTAAYTELDQNNFDVRNISQSVRRNLTDVSAKGSWGVTAKTSIGTGLDFNSTEYPDSGNVDSDVWTAPLDWYYAISPKVDLSAGYRYRQSKLDRRNSDSKDHFANVGARGRFTSKLEGQFRVGYTRREPDMGISSSLLGLTSALTFAATPKSTLGLTVSNDFDSSASGASQKTLRVSATGEYAMTPQWSATTEVSYESSEEIGPSQRTDEFWVGSVGTSYAFSLTTSMQVSYLYRTNDSNIEVVNFENNVISVSASMRF